ncbi:MAG: GNAT family N-acetyltransferase [Spirochaetaceae bacterium]
MVNKYKLEVAGIKDIDLWMNMIGLVKDNFPGLDTDEEMINYRITVLKNIKRNTALCVKSDNVIIGILIFSLSSNCLGCMAVHPDHRRNGVATIMVNKMINLFPDNSTISVSTFRENDIRGTAPRALYKKFGFIESELTVEFEYPHQKFYLVKK